MSLFKCSHKARDLIAHRAETARRAGSDFDIVTFHMICAKCKSPVDFSYAKLVGGVEDFFKRSGASRDAN